MDNITLSTLFRMKMPFSLKCPEGTLTSHLMAKIDGISTSNIVICSDDYLELSHPLHKYYVKISIEKEKDVTRATFSKLSRSIR